MHHSLTRYTQLIGALLCVCATGAQADSENTWYHANTDLKPVLNAYHETFERESLHSNIKVGDTFNGYNLSMTQGQIQLSNDDKLQVMSDFQIDDKNQTFSQNRAYNYQSGLGSSSATIEQINSRNLALIAQEQTSKNARALIEQRDNQGGASKAMIVDRSHGSQATIKQEVSEESLASVNFINGDNESNTAYISQHNSKQALSNINIDGDLNHTYVEQSGIEGVSSITLSGQDNMVNVAQLGNQNISVINSINDLQSNSSHVQMEQMGSNNQGYLALAGESNMAMTQQMSHNDALHSAQLSNNNQLRVSQH